MTTDASQNDQLFISYSTADKVVVTAICDQLRARGIPVWIDQNEIVPGNDIVARINDGLTQAKVFVAFIGESYFANGRYTASEFGAAFHKAMAAPSWHIMVVRLSPDIDLPPLAKSRLYIDHTTPSETAEKLARVLVRLNEVDQMGENAKSAAGSRVDLADLSDLDIELVVSALMEQRLALLRTGGNDLECSISLPRRRRITIRLLRALMEKEALALTLQALQERIEVNQRYVSRFTAQIDQGFLGIYETGAQIELENRSRTLADVRRQVREQLTAMIDDARLSSDPD
jgi:hypothetical protein